MSTRKLFLFLFIFLIGSYSEANTIEIFTRAIANIENRIQRLRENSGVISMSEQVSERQKLGTDLIEVKRGLEARKVWDASNAGTQEVKLWGEIKTLPQLNNIIINSAQITKKYLSSGHIGKARPIMRKRMATDTANR